MKFKKIRIILGFSVLMVSFQNCNAPSTATNPNSTTEGSKSSASPSVNGGSSSGTGNNGLNSGSARSISGGKSASSGSGGFGGVKGGSAGSMGGGSSSGSSGSGTCLGCGSGSGSGSSGSGGSGVIGTGDTTFRIVTQPSSKTINENTEFFLGITVQGGRSPYSFKWYRNSEELPPKFGNVHYESYSDVLDRIYKEGEYYVVATDGAGTRLTSNRAQIRMNPKLCGRGNYFIDLSIRTNTSDGYSYFNDLFYYKTSKYLVSQNNPTIVMMQLQNNIRYINNIGFSYFTLGGDVSNNQNFSIECSTDVPTIHTSECATNSTRKCYYHRYDGYQINRTYEGGINFLCRNGYIEFISNTCRLVTPPDSGGGG